MGGKEVKFYAITAKTIKLGSHLEGMKWINTKIKLMEIEKDTVREAAFGDKHYLRKFEKSNAVVLPTGLRILGICDLQIFSGSAYHHEQPYAHSFTHCLSVC